MKKQKFTVIRGIPGSGKTTLANLMAKQNGAMVVEADQFFEGEQGGYKYDRAFIKEAHTYCQTMIKKHLFHGKDVICSNTSVYTNHVEELIGLARDVVPDIEVAVLRVDGGYQSVHDVPEEVISGMRNRFQDYPGEFVV